MNKKKYIKPEVVEIQLSSMQMLAASSFNPESGDNYGGDEAGSNGRRGEWGNLWAETK